MSLKAKLEAVIYAADEPVTLSQLAALFAADALEWKAEQTAEAANPPQEAAAALPLNGEFDYAEAEVDAGSAAPERAMAPEQATEPEASPEAGAASGAEPVVVDEAAAEAEARRLARQRDREVRAILRQLLDELVESYAHDGRGVEIREIAGGFRMATKPECHDAVRAFVKSLKPPLKLSLPALETLAVIAYKQPVTAPEVNEIRGVDSSAVFGSLLARKLIATAGRKQVIGRPILYKTTREFLLRFGLKDVAELPSMEEFEKMAAAELDEPEAEGESAPEIREDLSLELEQPAGEEPADEQPADEPAASAAEENLAAEAESTTLEAAPAQPSRTE
jgi:segregation and condensation protein B